MTSKSAASESGTFFKYANTTFACFAFFFSFSFVLLRLGCSYTVEGSYFNDVRVALSLDISWIIYLSSSMLLTGENNAEAATVLNNIDLYHFENLSGSSLAIVQVFMVMSTIFYDPIGNTKDIRFNSHKKGESSHLRARLHQALTHMDSLLLLGNIIIRCTALRADFKNSSSTSAVFITVALMNLFEKYPYKKWWGGGVSLLEPPKGEANEVVENKSGIHEIAELAQKCDIDGDKRLNFFEFASFVNTLRIAQRRIVSEDQKNNTPKDDINTPKDDIEINLQAFKKEDTELKRLIDDLKYPYSIYDGLVETELRKHDAEHARTEGEFANASGYGFKYSKNGVTLRVLDDFLNVKNGNNLGLSDL